MVVVLGVPSIMPMAVALHDIASFVGLWCSASVESVLPYLFLPFGYSLLYPIRTYIVVCARTFLISDPAPYLAFLMPTFGASLNNL